MPRTLLGQKNKTIRVRKETPMKGIPTALLRCCVSPSPKTGFYDQGYSPAGLAEGADGSLYGGNSAGGPNSIREAFKVSKAGTGFQVWRHFAQAARRERNARADEPPHPKVQACLEMCWRSQSETSSVFL